MKNWNKPHFCRRTVGKHHWVPALACIAISLGPVVGEARELGNVQFETTCTPQADAAFNEGLGLLHHMMYFQADSHFSSAAERDPDCAMLHWGVAMSRFHPLWPRGPSAEVIASGSAAVELLHEAPVGSGIEQAFATAATAFYAGENTGYRDRIAAWASAQKAAFEQFPEDEDAIAFYALSLLATAPRGDKSMKNQREAGALVEALNEKSDLHPGVYHYLIHAYDNPVLYERALPFAAEYGKIAPDVAHSLHMPSHIFVRAGYWDEVIEWNIRSAKAARAQPIGEVFSSHYAHAMDYLIYGHLQRGEYAKAEELLAEFTGTLNQQSNFGSAYALAASPVRVALEQEQWGILADLSGDMHPAIAWERFPQAIAIRWFAIGLGAARSDDVDKAREALLQLADLRAPLEASKQVYWLKLLDAQMLSVEAWMEKNSGNSALAISLQSKAADIEDAVGKSPVTPGHVLPARELLGDLFAELGRTDEADQAYKDTLARTPNRLRSLQALK